MIQKVVAARSGFKDVNRWIYPLLDQSSIEMQFHISCSLELLENDFVHTTFCLDQSSRQDRETASLLTIARRTKKTLWLQERLGFHAAGHDASFPGLKCVISPGQACNAIQKNDHILFELDQPFCPFAYQFGYLDMSSRALVKRRAEYFAIQALFQVGDFFG